jgi:hypothetical protein
MKAIIITNKKKYPLLRLMTLRSSLNHYLIRIRLCDDNDNAIRIKLERTLDDAIKFLGKEDECVKGIIGLSCLESEVYEITERLDEIYTEENATKVMDIY